MIKFVAYIACFLYMNVSFAGQCVEKNQTFDSRYSLLNGNAEVLDKKTNLVWQRCSIGQSFDGKTCTGRASALSLGNAQQAAADSGDNWRVPSLEELSSIVDRCSIPTINSKFFPNTPRSNFTWTISPSPQITRSDNDTWLVNFNDGASIINFMHYKRSFYFLRLVKNYSVAIPATKVTKAVLNVSQKAPFVGERSFNFYGGTGTGYEMTIDASGHTIVTSIGVVESNIVYKGKFVNPIWLSKNKDYGLLFKDGKIYALNENNYIDKGCLGEEDSPCVSDLID